MHRLTPTGTKVMLLSMVGVLANQVGHRPASCHSTPKSHQRPAPSPELTGTQHELPPTPKHRRHTLARFTEVFGPYSGNERRVDLNSPDLPPQSSSRTVCMGRGPQLSEQPQPHCQQTHEWPSANSAPGPSVHRIPPG